VLSFPLPAHASEIAAKRIAQLAQFAQPACQAFTSENIVDTTIVSHVEGHAPKLADPFAEGLEHSRQTPRSNHEESHGHDDQ